MLIKLIQSLYSKLNTIKNLQREKNNNFKNVTYSREIPPNTNMKQFVMALNANFITCQKFNLPYLFNDKFMCRKM